LAVLLAETWRRARGRRGRGDGFEEEEQASRMKSGEKMRIHAKRKKPERGMDEIRRNKTERDGERDRE
jgi:hypothetical protein